MPRLRKPRSPPVLSSSSTVYLSSLCKPVGAIQNGANPARVAARSAEKVIEDVSLAVEGTEETA
ncbi:hypothetical protein EGH25_03755 [Haladaptatus sp. F3-133]|uniref:Uncharacterized protein n=1 Tax=Halorutilus salinus TaxID=2487751 RepID=A0A9Q4GI50_9EURY|nr:hypothetical protein [Halorutilus salinus]MCX2818468.1 hypothetical protein [Halorutilus salinus]